MSADMINSKSLFTEKKIKNPVEEKSESGLPEKYEKMLKGEKCDLESSTLSKREWNELMESFGFKDKIL